MLLKPGPAHIAPSLTYLNKVKIIFSTYCTVCNSYSILFCPIIPDSQAKNYKLCICLRD